MKTTRRSLSCIAAAAFAIVAVGCGSAATRAPIATTPPSKSLAPLVKGSSAAAEIRAQLAAHRRLQLERLAEYAAAGEFPRNYASPGAIHLFRDGDGRLCAVANLVHRDGLDTLVDETAKTHNDVVLADVKDGPLMDWVLASGLTVEEVAAIQFPSEPLDYGAKTSSSPPAVPPEPPPLTVAQMQEKLRAHFAEVARAIEASTDASLDVAVQRFEASPIASRPIAMGGLTGPSAMD